MSSARPFSVLFVCTGNICRFPAAERLFHARVEQAGPFEVSGAGVRGLIGRPIDGPSALALRGLGVASDGHLARRVTTAMVTRSDLILAADSSHRSTILQRVPLAWRRTFTLLEFGRLGISLAGAEDLDRASLVARVAVVAAQRGGVPAPALRADDIGDPFGGRWMLRERVSSGSRTASMPRFPRLGSALRADWGRNHAVRRA